MDCAAVQPLLSPYLDGELDGSDREAVAIHLDHCSNCQHLLRELRNLTDLWSSSSPPEPSAQAWQQISRKLARLEDGSPGRSRLRRWLAASILVFICGSAALAMAKFGGERFWIDVERARAPINLVSYLDDEKAESPGKTVDLDQICNLVNFPTLEAPDLPDGYKLQKCSVFRDGVVRYKYARGDAEVILLLYECGHTVVHGNKPLMNFELDGKPLKIAQCKKRVSASWQANNTAVSLIGSHELVEFVKLLRFVDGQLAGTK